MLYYTWLWLIRDKNSSLLCPFVSCEYGPGSLPWYSPALSIAFLTLKHSSLFCRKELMLRKKKFCGVDTRSSQRARRTVGTSELTNVSTMSFDVDIMISDNPTQTPDRRFYTTFALRRRRRGEISHGLSPSILRPSLIFETKAREY